MCMLFFMESPQWPTRTRLPPLPEHVTRPHTGPPDGGNRSSAAQGRAPDSGSAAQGRAPDSGSAAQGRAPDSGPAAQGRAPDSGIGPAAQGRAPGSGSAAQGRAPDSGPAAQGRAPYSGIGPAAQGRAPDSGPAAQFRAPELRRLLTQQLPLGGRATPGDMSALAAGLLQFLSGGLQGFSHDWWLELLDILRLLRPFRERLARERGRLLPSLEQLSRRYERQRPLLRGLDVPGALRAAFPPDTSTLFRLPEDLESRYRAQEPPVYVHDLAHYVGGVGAELAAGESLWRCGRKDLRRALRTDLPLTVPADTEPAMEASGVPEDLQHHPQPEKGPGATDPQVTGYEAAEILVKYRHLGKVIFLYLNRAGGLQDCSYDLRVTHVSQAQPEHFVFSPFGILHVNPTGASEVQDLGVWHREAVICRTLRRIPFYRDFLRRRLFRRWQRNVRRICFLRRREMLSRRMLTSAPHYTAALHHINRFLQELARMPWLPTHISNPIPVDQLETVQRQIRSEAKSNLRRLRSLASRVLEMVRQDTYIMVHTSQEDAAHFEEASTRGRLHHLQSWLHRLGNLSCLVGQMICENLVSILQQNISTFVSGVTQMMSTTGRSFLLISLEFGEDGALRLCPSACQIQHSVEQILEGALDAVLEVLDTSDPDDFALPPMTRPPTEHGSPVHPVLAGQYLRQVVPAPALQPEKCKKMLPPGGLKTEGQQQTAHYLPLNLQSLHHMLHRDCLIQEARRKLQRLLEESLVEVTAFCEDQAWLIDIHRYVQSWAPHILENLRGSSSQDYEDLILKVQHWEQRVCGLKDCVTTAMLEVSCEPIHTQTGPGLGAILQDILVLLTSEVADKSHSLIDELSQALEVFRGVSTEISSFSKCAHKVAEYKLRKHELEERVEHVRSLHEVIRMNYHQQTAEEQRVSSKLAESWDMFQHFLKSSAEFLSSHLSSMSGRLELSFQACYREAEDLIAASSSAHYRDPSQNVAPILRDLGTLHHKLCSSLSQLRDFSHSRQVLHGKSFVFSVILDGQQQIQARQDSWRLLSGCREQINAWKRRPFVKVNIDQMGEKLQQWEKKLQDLTLMLSGEDPILQSVGVCLQDFGQPLPLLRSLLDPALTPKHWAAIFAVMGKTYEGLETLTLKELLSCPLLKEQEPIHKVLLGARAEFSVLQDLRKVQTFWQEREFRLVRFFLCVSREDPPPEPSKRPPSGRFRDCAKGPSTRDTGTFLLADSHSLCTLIDDSLLSLQTIERSPYSAPKRDEISGWIQKLKNLGHVLDLWVTFQRKWVFLTKVQSEMEMSLPGMEMVREFQSIDLSYRSFLEVSVQDPLVLSVLAPSRRRGWHFHGDSLCSALLRGISTMETMMVAMEDVLYGSRCDFPRLFFLSDQDVIDVLAASPEPSDRLPCALRCFPHFTHVLFHVQPPESSGFPLISSHTTVGVTGKYGETLNFRSPITWNPRTVSWLIQLEQTVQESLREQLSVSLTEGRLTSLHRPTHQEDLKRWLERGMTHSLQCLAVTEEVVWCEDVERLILTDQRSRLTEGHNTKIEILVQKLRQVDGVRAEGTVSVRQGQAFLSAWVSLAILQRDRTLGLLESGMETLGSFSWAKLMKYRAPTRSALEETRTHPSPLCVVDMMGHLLPYEYEYVGLDMTIMDAAVSERTSLGLVLALQRYQCGAVIGQDEGLSTQTLVALGSALGRQVVVLKCWSGLNVDRLTLHLQGALQAGAWLVLTNAHQLKSSVLASLGQLLGDIQSSCEALMREGRTDAIDRGAETIGRVQCAERTVSMKRSYGCILTLPHMDSSVGLPSNLHLLLRPVSFCPPDLQNTAELALLSAGFQEHFVLAKKISFFLRLARECGAVSAASVHSLLKSIVQKAIVILTLDREAMRSAGDTVHHQPPLHMASECPTVTPGVQEEASVVTALLASSLWSSCPEDSHLMDLLRSVFPVSLSPLPRREAADVLLHAVQLHLHESGLEGHPELSNNVMWLFQAIQQSPGVLLTGPSGSGKTTCWRALQWALNHLATNHEAAIDVPISPPYQSVHSVHLFPNSLDPSELLGGGSDGNHVFSNILHRTVQQSAVQKWIILDGSVAPKWVEPISCLFGPQPVLTLASGQPLHLTDQIKLLLEMPDTSALSPAMSTRCSFVYCGGQETWRTIVKASLSNMYIRYHITPSTQHKLQTLSEHLIPRTLCFLQEHCTSALYPHPTKPTHSARGVHQVSSFCTILQALMDQHLLRDTSHWAPEQTEHTVEEPLATAQGSEDGATSTLPHNHPCTLSDNHLRAQTLFLYSFIWAFGGHLHPRHRSEFDGFLRKSLVGCVLQVVIPQDASVFEVTPTPDALTLTANPGAGHVQSEGLLYAARLLALSGHAVLLVGAPGSGKTTLAQSLMPPGASATRIPVNSMLQAAHLRQLLRTQHENPPAMEVAKVKALRGRKIFFLDDLHEAGADPESGAKPALEVIRQLGSDNGSRPQYSFLATTSPPEDGYGSLCPRLSHLFCVLVMAPSSSDVLLSLFSPRLMVWLKKSIPGQQPKEFGDALAAASISLYHEVTKTFPSKYCFSLHHLHRLLHGLTFLCPSVGANLPTMPDANLSAADLAQCGIVRIWLREASRTFGDGLETGEENKMFRDLLRRCALRTFSNHDTSENAADGAMEPPPSNEDGLQPIPPKVETNGIRNEDGLQPIPTKVETNGIRNEDGLQPIPTKVEANGIRNEDGLQPIPPKVETNGITNEDGLQPIPTKVEANGIRNEDGLQPIPPKVETNGITNEDGLQPIPTKVETNGITNEDGLQAIPPKVETNGITNEDGLQPIPPKVETNEITNEDVRTEPDVASHSAPRKFLLPPELLVGDGDLQDLHHEYSHGRHVRSDCKAVNIGQMHLTLSPQDCHHLALLTRVLHLPRGHIVLLSKHPGTGRKSLARLAAQHSQCALLELRGEGTAEERHTIMREACWRAGVQGSAAALLAGEDAPQGSAAALLAGEDAPQGAQQELEALMREGTFPGLYSPEQEEAVLQAMLQMNEKSSNRNASNKSLRERYNLQVRNNLHVIFLQKIGARCPPLQRLAYQDMYYPWSATSLQQVAEKLLEPSRIRGSPTFSLSRAMSFIHLLAQNYSHRMWPNLPLTSPRAFTRFIHIYLQVSSELQDAIDQEEERLRWALSRVEQVCDGREQCTLEMEKCSRCLQEVVQEKKHWSKELEEIQKEERRATLECEELERVKERAGSDLTRLQSQRQQDREQACLQWASVQKDLTLLDVEEIRSYRAPPPPVITVTNVLCTLFGKESGWENAKLLIGQENFYQELQFYDGHTMADKVFASLTRAVSRPEFSVHLVRPVSAAAASLCQWLRGLQRYCSILRALEKGRARLAEVEAEDLQMVKRIAGQRLLQEKLRVRKVQTSQNLQKAQETEQVLQRDLQQLRNKQAVAQVCESRAQPHRTTWSSALEALLRRLQSLQVDALMVSAAITYLGCLPWTRCTSLLAKWWSVCHGTEVSVDPDDIREALDPPEQNVPGHVLRLLSSPPMRMVWQKERLPLNTETLTRAALLRAGGLCSEPTLILDPDLRAERWLQVVLCAQESGKGSPSYGRGDPPSPRGETRELRVMDASDKELTLRLSSAAEQGLCVLIRNVEKTPSCLEIVRSLQRGYPLRPSSSGRQEPPSRCNEEPPVTLEAPMSFQTFLCTRLPLRHFAEEVGSSFLKDVMVVDLSLGPSGLEEELVQEIALLKDPRLQEERWSLSRNALKLTKELRSAQDKLLDYVSSGRSPLVEDQDFLGRVSSCEEAQATLRSSLLDVEALQRRTQEHMTPYGSAAQRCVLLYSRLREVSRLSPHYHFPASSVLSWALGALHRPVGSGRELEKVLTRGVLARALPMIAEEHRRVLHVLLAVGQPPPLEWFSFLGLACRSETSSSCIQRPQWVDREAWEELGQLEKLSTFKGIRSSLSAQTKQWQEYFTLRSTLIGPIPCASFSHLTLFQAAILWRILKPEYLGLVLSHLTSCILGPDPGDTGEEGEVIRPSDPSASLLFLLPPLSPDLPTNYIRHMAKKSDRELRVLSWTETRPAGTSRAALLTCQREGQWLLMNWHPGLADLLATGEEEVNVDFRLWISAEEEALPSMPVALLRGSPSAPCPFRLTLRDVLLQSCLDAAEDVGEQNPLTLKLLMLHSVLLLRQEYSPYVQRRTYCWGDRDLRNALCAARMVRSGCQDWGEALPFIIGAVIYGGHIVEDEDARCVMAVVQLILQESHERGGHGPSYVMSVLAAGGATGPWMPRVTRSLQKLLSMRDPAALGLSEGLKNLTTKTYGHKVLSDLLITQDVWTVPPSTAAEHGAGLECSSSGPSSSPWWPEVHNTMRRCLALLLELEDEHQRTQLDPGGLLHDGQPGPMVDTSPILNSGASTQPTSAQGPPAATAPQHRDVASRPRPLLRFLLDEWKLFHILLRAATQEVRDAASSCCCQRCQDIRRVLGEGHVPPWWDVYSPASPTTLQDWTQGLHRRLRLLSSYISQSPLFRVTYNLSVFQRPRRLLQSLLQEQALKDHRELEGYRLHVQVSGRTSAPQPGGVSLVGIHLRYALWDTRLDLLQETLSPQLCALPVIHVCTAPESSATAQSHYLCPLYTGGSPGAHMKQLEGPLLLIPLPTNVSPGVWGQRQVHALSLL